MGARRCPIPARFLTPALAAILAAAALAAAPAPPGHLMGDVAGDANGLNDHTVGLFVAPDEDGVPTGPVQVAAADLRSGRLRSVWRQPDASGGSAAELVGIEVRLGVTAEPTDEDIELVTTLRLGECTVTVTARVAPADGTAPATTRVCGLAEHEPPVTTWAWDADTSEVVTTIHLDRAPASVRTALAPGATLVWSSSTTWGTRTRGHVFLDTARPAGPASWVVGSDGPGAG